MRDVRGDPVLTATLVGVATVAVLFVLWLIFSAIVRVAVALEAANEHFGVGVTDYPEGTAADLSEGDDR